MTDTKFMLGPDGSWWTRLKSVVDFMAGIAMVVVVIVIVWSFVTTGPGEPQPPPKTVAGGRDVPVPATPLPLDLAKEKTRGSRSAGVVVIQYSDFQCPFCGRFVRDILPDVNKKYVDTGKVLWVFRHLPLKMHRLAPKAAEAAECAQRQGKFWPMHDALFADKAKLEEANLREAGVRVGLDQPTFDACLTGETATVVSQESASAAVLKVSGTPVFFIGESVEGKSVRIGEVAVGGTANPADFEAFLERALKAIEKK